MTRRPARSDDVTSLFQTALDSRGVTITPAQERLAAYLAVENTYLSTFQVLGGFGLLLGALGLAVVLLRNVWERRGELALLRALGYRRRALGWLVFAENAALLAARIRGGSRVGRGGGGPARPDRARAPCRGRGWRSVTGSGVGRGVCRRRIGGPVNGSSAAGAGASGRSDEDADCRLWRPRPSGWRRRPGRRSWPTRAADPPCRRRSFGRSCRSWTPAGRTRFTKPLADAMKEFGINTPKRRAAFLAQVAQECRELRHQEEMFANLDAYENRADLGNTKAGDGKTFKGRGR